MSGKASLPNVTDSYGFCRKRVVCKGAWFASESDRHLLPPEELALSRPVASERVGRTAIPRGGSHPGTRGGPCFKFDMPLRFDRTLPGVVQLRARHPFFDDTRAENQCPPDPGWPRDKKGAKLMLRRLNGNSGTPTRSGHYDSKPIKHQQNQLICGLFPIHIADL